MVEEAGMIKLSSREERDGYFYPWWIKRREQKREILRTWNLPVILPLTLA
jgi:hypothetical protein